MNDEDFIFETRAGSDIEIIVTGWFSKPDHSCGYNGGFQIDKIFLKNDESQTDIWSLLNDRTLSRIEHEGFDRAYEADAFRARRNSYRWNR